jgi:wobble nucleotide-excising tRNase
MLLERKNSLSEEKHLQEVAAQLLKDTGIKTAVVKEYLPIMNQLINKYLAMFDFFVDFTLDESFNEVIRSRGRDVFSYSSFSEGEKRRIDFAILMAFRQLASLFSMKLLMVRLTWTLV